VINFLEIGSPKISLGFLFMQIWLTLLRREIPQPARSSVQKEVPE
jgi:hypothetical protein